MKAKDATHFLRKSWDYFMIKWRVYREKALDTLGSSPGPHLLAVWLRTNFLTSLKTQIFFMQKQDNNNTYIVVLRNEMNQRM